MTDINNELVQKVSDLIIQTANDVIMPRFGALSHGEGIMQKSDKTLVTIADQEAEKVLTPALMALLPGSIVMGEESYEADPTIKDRLDKAGYCWIIDPIDGTQNFADGNENFGVIISLNNNQETVAGWLYQPITGKLYSCVKGNGVKDKDGHAVQAPKSDVGNLSGHTRVRFFQPHPLYHAIQHVTAHSRDVNTGFAAVSVVEFIDLIEGRADFVINGAATKPWDHAAGQLMVRELGGVAKTLLSGQDYKPALDGYDRDDLLITAIHTDVFNHVKAVMQDGLEKKAASHSHKSGRGPLPRV